MDRVARLLSTSTKDSPILEIGASHSPIAPKADGWRTHVLDHTDRAGLIAKFGEQGVDVSRVEEVDTVWHSGPIDQAVAPDLLGQFDTVIASHVIEHIPDLLGFLKSAERLCKRGGVVALAVPDQRYCFDYFRPRSSTGDVLAAYATHRTRHTVSSLWDYNAYRIDMNGTGAWGQHPVASPALTTDFGGLRRLADDILAGAEGAEYEDCHGWTFTPAGFRLIMFELALLGQTDWRIAALHGPDGCEFIVHLRRGAERVLLPRTVQERRLGLLLEQLHETAEQLTFAGEVLGLPLFSADTERRVAELEQRFDQLRQQVFGDEPVADAAGAATPPDNLALLGRKVEHLTRASQIQDERLAGLERVLARIVAISRPLLPLWRAIRPARR